jgi:hypothetical protein
MGVPPRDGFGSAAKASLQTKGSPTYSLRITSFGDVLDDHQSEFTKTFADQARWSARIY